MDNPYILNASLYLIEAIFGLFLLLIMLRFLLQVVRADIHNPLSQFLVKATNPVLRPLRRIIPGLAGIDLASIVLLFAIQMLELSLLNLASGLGFNATALAVMSIARLLNLLLTIYLMTILIQVILSWIGPQTYNPVVSLLYSINEPVLRPARRLLPAMGGLDLSPLIVLVVIQLTRFLIVDPISDLGRALALG